jgi:hypothetical protein
MLATAASVDLLIFPLDLAPLIRVFNRSALNFYAGEEDNLLNVRGRTDLRTLCVI